MENQENLFNEILDLKYRIQSLAANIQNPFEDVNEEDMKSYISSMEEDFENFIFKLNDYKERCKQIMLNGIKK